MTIVLGDPKSVLALPPAEMKNRGDWIQADSDVLAHLIQVNQQIRDSRWRAAKNSFRVQGDVLLESECPDLEAFVFAAVYFRQLYADRDRLLRDAVECYCKFVDPIRGSWVHHEERRFFEALDGPAWPLNAGRDAPIEPTITVRELFEAFLYGAGLLHRLPNENNEKRKRLLRLHDTEKPYRVLFALNGSLSRLGEHLSKIVVVIYRDYAHWQQNYSIPLPDVRWHDRLFNPFRVLPAPTAEHSTADDACASASPATASGHGE